MSYEEEDTCHMSYGAQLLCIGVMYICIYVCMDVLMYVCVFVNMYLLRWKTCFCV
jgi:hypothetical protein